MTTRTNRSPIVLSVLFALLLAAPGVGRSQDGDPAPWEPTRWSDETISLMDAVRTAIEHNPNLALESRNVLLQEGVLQEATGRFDGSLIANLSFDYTREALRASQKADEEKNRQELRDDIAATQQSLDVNAQILDELQGLQNDPTGFQVSDPDIQTVIDVLNTQIANANGAQQQDLIDLRNRTIARAIDNAQEDRGDLLMDLQSDQETLAKLGSTPEETENYFGLFSVEYSKPLRSGITLGPDFQYTLSGNRYVGKPVDIFRGGLGVEDVYRGELGFNFSMPLGRGFGKVATAADERAARFTLDASRENLSHVGSSTVLSTALAYWDLVSAQERVAVLEDLVGIQDRLVDLTGVLIQADEIPRTENARVGARRAEIQSQLESARRSEESARVALADALGLSVDALAEAPRAADAFPTIPEDADAAALDLASLIAGALDQRADYRAGQLLVDSTEALLAAAQANLKPIVDLDTRIWYTAVGENDAKGALTNRLVGPSYNLALSVEWPFANNVQEGRLLQARSRNERQQIATEDLARRIRSSVVELVTTLQQTVAQARYSDAAASKYQESLDAEIELFQAGSSTLIDTLLTEQRLTEARLSRVTVRQLYAQLLAQLRFVTGTLISDTGDGAMVEESTLLTLPGRNGSAS